jgi:FKBP-type peptidyl-prolyl cis-trans isomerase FkpA
VGCIAVKNKQLQMKQTIFTLLLFCVTGLMSCRKDKFEPTIKQYDQIQIQNYISANGLTGMIRDTVGGDTTGMYYKIIQSGSGTPMAYTDRISIVFTLRSFDGKYTSSDTINNHFFDFLGHIASDKLPLGLQTALINDLKYPGSSMRLLIPSHLAYGLNGFGSGSIQNANTRIAGNQCLDYYVHVIGDINENNSNLTTYQQNQAAYDEQVIQNYMKNTNLTGYTKTADGLYYKILTPATGTDPITVNSTITYTATGQLFNGIVIDDQNVAAATSDINGLIMGMQEALIGNASVGTKISILMPSILGYGTNSQSSTGANGATVTVPSNSCLRFTFAITAVTP